MMSVLAVKMMGRDNACGGISTKRNLLLQGHLQRGAGTADALVDLSKDTSLRRRIQSLQRFLLQQLHREAAPPGQLLKPAQSLETSAAACNTWCSAV